MRRDLTFQNVRDALDTQIPIAGGTALNGAKILMVFVPISDQFKIYENNDLDSVYSSFGANLAINRFNQLMKSK